MHLAFVIDIYFKETELFLEKSDSRLRSSAVINAQNT